MPDRGSNPTTKHPRRVLVTGGAGFIGSHLCDQLLAEGRSVVVVDNLSTGRRSNLPATHEDLSFIESDVREAILGPLTHETFDEIYHLAAAVGVKLVIDDPISAIDTNVELTSAVLRFAARAGPRQSPAPVLIASSSEVYGKSTKTPFHEDDDSVYGSTTITRWSYACSKAIDEFLALAYHRQRAVPAVVTRFFNTVGPRQLGEYGMVLPRFVAAALDDAPLTVHGDGTQIRCFCDVRDVVEVLPRLLRAPACHGRVFNVGSDTPISILDLANRVKSVLESKSPVTMVPYTADYPVGFEDLLRRVPSLDRLRDTVGFEPRFTLNQTIVDLAESISRRDVSSIHASAHRTVSKGKTR
ncbi:MAG: NAD-dependent epimerase/dehydratase family protein [Phycisphaerales bacterium]